MCSFRHSELARSNKTVCLYWSQGQCRSGAGCTFVHSGPSPQHSDDSSGGPTQGGGPPFCHFFQQGKCVKGLSCPYSHETISHGGKEAAGERRTEGTNGTEGTVGDATLTTGSVAEESTQLLAMQGALKATREGPSFHTRASSSKTPAADAEQHVQSNPLRGGGGHDRPHQRGRGRGSGRGTGWRGPDGGGRGGRGGIGMWDNMNSPMGVFPMCEPSIMLSPMGPVQISMGPNGPAITPIPPASFEKMMREGSSQVPPMPMNEAVITPLMGEGIHSGSRTSSSKSKMISPSIIEAADGGFVTRKKLKKMEGGETGTSNWQQQNNHHNQQQSQQQQRNMRGGGVAMQRNFEEDHHRHHEKKQEQRRRSQQNERKGSSLRHGRNISNVSDSTENAKPVTFKVRSLEEMKKSQTNMEAQRFTETAPEVAPVAAVSEVDAAVCPVLVPAPSKLSSPRLADLGDDLGNSFFYLQYQWCTYLLFLS